LNVELIAHTRLSDSFYDRFNYTGDLGYEFNDLDNMLPESAGRDGAAVALTAIRTCYSANKPTEILEKEGERYFGRQSEGGGTEADRLIRQIVASKHTSTLEHITYTFAIEGVSRALLAQLTRHRIGFSFSVQSQRYVKMSSEDKTGGFDYVVPPSLAGKYSDESERTAEKLLDEAMELAQIYYDDLRYAGVPAEDARMVLPNAATTNLVMTVNLRALLDFYEKRRPGNGAQWEIAALAERLRQEVERVDPWTEPLFEN
jgi:thymidylate synthase (FAD)